MAKGSKKKADAKAVDLKTVLWIAALHCGASVRRRRTAMR